ncbi:MAG: major capsid protein [Comamonas sp.]
METKLKGIEMNKFAIVRMGQKSKLAALAVIGLGMTASLPASAAAIDVAAVVTDIGAQAVPVGLIGGAVLLIYLAVKAFKWVRAALA